MWLSEGVACMYKGSVGGGAYCEGVACGRASIIIIGGVVHSEGVACRKGKVWLSEG